MKDLLGIAEAGVMQVIDQNTTLRIQEIWQRLGLDSDNPLKTHDDNQIDIGPDGSPIIEIEAVNDATTTIQTRTP